MAEKHQEAVYSDQQENSGDTCGNNPEKPGIQIDLVADKADNVCLKENLRDQGGAECQQDNSGNRYQNPVQNTNFHAIASVL